MPRTIEQVEDMILSIDKLKIFLLKQDLHVWNS